VATAQARLSELTRKEPTSLSVERLPEELEVPFFSQDGTKAAGIDWSIPGQNISVYDYTTEKLTPITRFDWKSEGHGITYWPVFSPDAKEVAYWFEHHDKTKGRSELRVSTLDGKSRILYRNKGTIVPCDWLPDGSAVLAFAMDENKSWKLGLVPAQGGEFKVLRDIGPKRTSAAVSPDGRFIIFGDGPQGKRDIKVMTVKGKIVGLLTTHPSDDENALWSPDGNYVAFMSDRHGDKGLWGVAVKDGRPADQPFLIKPGMKNTGLLNWTAKGLVCETYVITRDVFVMPFDPETAEPLAEARMVDYAPTGCNMTPVWSPDGKHMAFLAVRDKAYIVVMPASGGRAREYPAPLDRFWGDEGTWMLMHLRWLPDSRGLGFKTMYPLSGDTLPTLFCLDLESEEWKSWPVPVSWNGTWGMNGTSYIYESRKRAERGLLERDLSTGEERFIYRMPSESKSAIRNLWSSSDYKKLIFSIGDVGWIVLNVETGEAKILGKVKMRRPSWSPDGKRILAIDRTETEGEPDIDKMFTMPEEGGEPKYINLGDNLPKDYELTRADWSPDGRQIAFHTRTWFHENYILKNIIPKK
jgi:Tol biopolymer transport system component